MQLRAATAAAFATLSAGVLAACTSSGDTAPPTAPRTSAGSSGVSSGTPSSSEPTGTTGSTVPGATVFVHDDPGAAIAANARAVRSKAVTIDTAALLTADGQPRDTAIALTLNLFPDATYSTTLRTESAPGGVDTWSGALAGIKASSVTVVRTSGVFIVKVASPRGVFEISNIGGERYRLDELDPKGGYED